LLETKDADDIETIQCGL